MEHHPSGAMQAWFEEVQHQIYSKREVRGLKRVSPLYKKGKSILCQEKSDLNALLQAIMTKFSGLFKYRNPHEKISSF